MGRFGLLLLGLLALFPSFSISYADSPWLYGIHWFGPSTNNGDVTAMTGGKAIWSQETVMTNNVDQWGPSSQLAGFQNIVAQGHTIIMRVQPVWGKAFPLPGDTNPSMTQFLDQVTSTAQLYSNVCHIWFLGNEMNFKSEWGDQQLTPESYIDAAAQFSDRIKAVASSLGPQIVLIGPPAVGDSVDSNKWMGCTEYWNRMCDAVITWGYQNKFDGAAMHAYADPNKNLAASLAEFETDTGFGYQYQIGLLDAKGFTNKTVYITEWNRYVGSVPGEAISAQFLYQALSRMDTWSQTHHPVTAACWYVYHDFGGWSGYSLRSLKTGGGTRDDDVWAAFQYACTLNLPARYPNTGPTSTPTITPTPTKTPTPGGCTNLTVDDYFNSASAFDSNWTGYGTSPVRFIKNEWWCSATNQYVEIQSSNGGYRRTFTHTAGASYTLTMEQVRGKNTRYIRIDSNGGTNPAVYDRSWTNSGGDWVCETPSALSGTVGASGKITVFLGTAQNGQYKHLRVVFTCPSGPTPTPTRTPTRTNTPLPTNTPTRTPTPTNTPVGPIAQENFETMPAWSSSFDAGWGGAATWSIVAGGQSGNALQASRTNDGSSAKAKVYTVPAGTNITISGYMRSGTGTGYWAEFAYKLGSYTAQNFDESSGTWTMIQKFANNGTNGNGNVWTQYSKAVNTGSNTQVSVGYKLGRSGGTAPVVQWDTFRIQ